MTKPRDIADREHARLVGLGILAIVTVGAFVLGLVVGLAAGAMRA